MHELERFKSSSGDLLFPSFKLVLAFILTVTMAKHRGNSFLFLKPSMFRNCINPDSRRAEVTQIRFFLQEEALERKKPDLGSLCLGTGSCLALYSEG